MRNFTNDDMEGGALAGKLLVAMPGLNDSFFDKTLIFICAHDVDGAIGVVLNKPETTATKNVSGGKKLNYKVYTGGPIDQDKLFILSTDGDDADLDVQTNQPKLVLFLNSEGFINDTLAGFINKKFMVFKGFCGWNAGQLEKEIEDNDWIIMNADTETIFQDSPEDMWNNVMKKLGITNLEQLVQYSGRA